MDNNFIHQVRQIIENNLDNPELGPELIAQQVFLNRTQVHRRLIKLIGTPISEFIQQIRIEKATELLCATNKNLLEIAFDVGFKDPSHFTKVFKKWMGKLPSEYRKGC